MYKYRPKWLANDEKWKIQHWLKRPKAVPQKRKLGPKYKWFKISYLDFFFENIIAGIQQLNIHPHVPVDTIRVFFFYNSDILAKSLKAKTITSEKDDLFHNTVRSKTSLILRASTHLTLKIGCSLSTAKSLSDFTNFQQTCFCLVLEKVFVLYICGCPITAFSRHF